MTHQRCLHAEDMECQFGDPSMIGIGDRNVPDKAWYIIASADEQHRYIRCECGCFPGDVQILTTKGYEPIRDLAENSKSRGLRFAIADQESSELKASSFLFGPDFTVGPEQKPIYRVVANNGAVVDLTNTHSVLVVKGGNKRMIQAKDIAIGDILLSANGAHVEVVDVTSYVLPAGDDLVYNLNTKDAAESGHVIIANGLQMGDLYCQKKLSERNSRINNFLN